MGVVTAQNKNNLFQGRKPPFNQIYYLFEAWMALQHIFGQVPYENFVCDIFSFFSDSS